MTLVAPAAADDDDPSSSHAARTTQTPLRPIRAGLVGCGTIAASIAIGLAETDHVPHLARFGLRLSSISVTRRSETKSRMLEERFPKFVTVYESAWEVVAECELVFLCVLPDQVDGVLADLAEKGVWRREDHTLVSLVVRHCCVVS
jgi:pyrroline-5-carboxylate reductase